MNLKEYARIRKSNPYLTLEELGQIRRDIRELIKEINQIQVKAFSPEAIKALLSATQERTEGFAAFLLDYRGMYDETFVEIAKELSSFAATILGLNVPFADAEYRLLEITQRYDLAVYCPQKENVAKFILCNLEKFKQDDFKEICRRIENMTVYELCDKEVIRILYKICRAKPAAGVCFSDFSKNVESVKKSPKFSGIFFCPENRRPSRQASF